MSKGRGGIGNVIAILVLILFGMVAHNAWFKERDRTPAPPQAPLQEPLAPPAQTDPPLSTTLSETLPLDPAVPDMREGPLSEPEALSAFPHTATLAEIRSLIEVKNATEAEVKLTTLTRELPDDPELHSIVAILWNNLGVLQKKTRGAAASIQAYKAGLALNPESPALNLNLAHAYWETQDPDLTVDFLEHLVELAPKKAFPHLALAGLLYEEDDLAGATKHLEAATRLVKKNPEYKSLLAFVTKRVKGAERAERTFLARESSHFKVKYNGEENHEVWMTVLDILEEAYREIGQNFSYFPDEQITVILHTRRKFQAATGSPAWADGLFDPILGRIQIPTEGALTDRTWLTRVLRHEFVHALLHQRVGGRLGRVPTWLNEGLAMQLAGDPWPDIDQVIQGEVTLIPLNYLEGGWGRLSSKASMVAYLEGNSATLYLIDRYGMQKVREILGRVAAGEPIGAAIKDRLFISYEQFQHRWSDHLNDKIAAGRTS